MRTDQGVYDPRSSMSYFGMTERLLVQVLLTLFLIQHYQLIVEANGRVEFIIQLNSSDTTDSIICLPTVNNTDRTSLKARGGCSTAYTPFVEICLDHMRRMTDELNTPNCELGRLYSVLPSKISSNPFSLSMELPFSGAWLPEFAISLRLKVNLIGAGANRSSTTVVESTWHEKHLYSMREPRSENQSKRTALGDFREKLVNITVLAPGHVLMVRYRLVCDADFYGRTCRRFCRASKGVHGNFLCNPLTGEKMCLKGWSGEYCTKAVCRQPCIHGKCTGPNYCSCDIGWHGTDCNQCRVYPGCLHGSCAWNRTIDSFVPLTCECHSGWGGMLCDVALDYCKTHPDICRNHGQCVNTRDPNELFYRCLCKPGFKGKNCEITIPSCVTRGCSHAGTCVKQKDLSFKCQCDSGYFGDFCQFNQSSEQQLTFPSNGGLDRQVNQTHQSCGNLTCFNGGTCVSLDVGFQCHCLNEFEGEQCQIKTCHDHCVQSTPNLSQNSDDHDVRWTYSSNQTTSISINTNSVRWGIYSQMFILLMLGLIVASVLCVLRCLCWRQPTKPRFITEDKLAYVTVTNALNTPTSSQKANDTRKDEHHSIKKGCQLAQQNDQVFVEMNKHSQCENNNRTPRLGENQEPRVYVKTNNFPLESELSHIGHKHYPMVNHAKWNTSTFMFPGFNNKIDRKRHKHEPVSVQIMPDELIRVNSTWNNH